MIQFYRPEIAELKPKTHVSTSNALVKPSKTRGNKSFLHPDGGGPIADSANVPKNITSSASKTSTTVMPKHATTTTTTGTPTPPHRTTSAMQPKGTTPGMPTQATTTTTGTHTAQHTPLTPVMQPKGKTVQITTISRPVMQHEGTTTIGSPTAPPATSTIGSTSDITAAITNVDKLQRVVQQLDHLK